jgi:bifunctional pyridoxal-dependent enzyme with beta-cystathionase and maltose regulon repressor activities
MITDFEYTLTRGDIDFELLVEYTATRHWDEVEIDITSVTLDGSNFDITVQEDNEILEACYERVDEDFEGYAASEGDYRHDAAKNDF